MKFMACVLSAFAFLGMVVFTPYPVFAASQDECAIWLCLPGGFPQGCGAAHSAMIKRIKKRKPPLPSFGSCSVGGSGDYRMGYEPYEPCKEGFKLEINIDGDSGDRSRCISHNVHQFCNHQTDVQIEYNDDRCYYKAVKRPKPYFVEMWVDGDYLGKFFYQ
ncbi:MAG: hypothetical protein ACRBB3_10025 [Alphaproteobacteria bacterium]